MGKLSKKAQSIIHNVKDDFKFSADIANKRTLLVAHGRKKHYEDWITFGNLKMTYKDGEMLLSKRYCLRQSASLFGLSIGDKINFDAKIGATDDHNLYIGHVTNVSVL